MAEVTVLYFGRLRELAGRRSEKVKVDGSASALDLFREITARRGEDFRNFVLDDLGRPRESLAFAVNGDSIDYSNLVSKKCSEITEFAILPPISGGLSF